MGYYLKYQITGGHRKGLYQQGKSIINKTALVKNKARGKNGNLLSWAFTEKRKEPCFYETEFLGQ